MRDWLANSTARRAGALGLAALAFVLVAIATNARDVFAASEPPLIVTRDATDLPRGCSPLQTARAISAFFAAFNSGSAPAVLSRLAARRVSSDVSRDGADGRFGFQWYSAGEPTRQATVSTREGFVRYMRARRRHGERLRLVMVDVAPTWARYAVSISFVVTREADDIVTPGDAAIRFATGKGTLNCGPTKLAVWSMFGPPDEANWMCPVPADWTPGAAIVACRRG